MDSCIEKDSKNQNISLLHLIYSCFGQCFWFSIHLCRCFVRSESKIGGSRFLGMSVITSFMKLSWKAPTRGLEKGVKISGDTQILKILMVLILFFYAFRWGYAKICEKETFIRTLFRNPWQWILSQLSLFNNSTKIISFGL